MIGSFFIGTRVLKSVQLRLFRFKLFIETAFFISIKEMTDLCKRISG